MKKSMIRYSLYLFVTVSGCASIALAGEGEYTGQFETKLLTNPESLSRIILKSISPDKLKGKISLPEDAHLTAARLVDPRTQNNSILALLVEEVGEDPYILVDTNGDNALNDDEKLTLSREDEDNPYLWIATANIRLVEGQFKSLPIFLRYFKKIRYEKMGPDDRLIMQSTEIMVRARVNINNKDIVLQYAYDADKKKIDPANGWLGVDTDGNGEVDIHDLSPESTKTNEETVVFRVGDIYLSTKKGDIAKNQVVVKQHQAKDYKRAELWKDKEFPQFTFTDFDGKKRNFNEFRGKYVLLDIWGFWCPACRDELPYLREANKRFQSRGLVVLGLNTDEDYTIDSMKSGLNKAGMNWTHAQFTSIVDFLRKNLRIHSFPATFLISPEGKIISMNRTESGEKSLRGRDLLETLDDLLPAI